MVYTFNRYVWDPKKASSNFRKHGVTFEEATLAFNDPEAIYLEDPLHSTPFEIRESIIGEASERILFIVFTVRLPDQSLRIISARLANRRERKRYEENKK